MDLREIVRACVRACVDWLCLDQWRRTFVGDSDVYRASVCGRLQVALLCWQLIVLVTSNASRSVDTDARHRRRTPTFSLRNSDIPLMRCSLRGCRYNEGQ
jgi:hypothetical protein